VSESSNREDGPFRELRRVEPRRNVFRRMDSWGRSERQTAQ